MASTSSSATSADFIDLGDTNTDVDEYDNLRDENDKTDQEKLADDNQETATEKNKKKTSAAHSNFNFDKQNNTYSCIHCR